LVLGSGKIQAFLRVFRLAATGKISDAAHSAPALVSLVPKLFPFHVLVIWSCRSVLPLLKRIDGVIQVASHVDLTSHQQRFSSKKIHTSVTSTC
jgi:hypothetical protein